MEGRLLSMTFPKILLVGWDSADWEIARPLLDSGDMPNLEKVVSAGVMGNLAAPGPAISAALWTSIATGKKASQHGVLGALELSKEDHGVGPVTCSSRRSAAIWNMLSDRGSVAHVVGWPATHGESLARGCVVSERLPYSFTDGPETGVSAPSGIISPHRLIEGIGELRVSPLEIDASMVRLFVPNAESVNQDADPSLARLRVHLASGLTTQAVATWLLANEPWDFLAVRFDALGAISRDFMAFRSPGVAGIPQQRHQLYRDVVNSAYRFHDLMLGRLISLAGTDAIVVVVSQQGLSTDESRPIEHPLLSSPFPGRRNRPGLFAARGPGLRTDELIFVASQLDVTPTLLAMRGISAEEEMPGRAMTEIFIEPPLTPFSLRNGVQAASAIDTVDGAIDELVKSLKTSTENETTRKSGKAMWPCRQAVLTEQAWVMAQALLDERRPRAALPVLQTLFRQWPERLDFSQALADCQLRLGMIDEARSTTEIALDYVDNPATAALMRAHFSHRTVDYREALLQLDQAAALGPLTLDHERQRVLTLLALRRWKDAELICREAIDANPNHALIHLGLAQCQLRLGRPQSAVESASAAIGLDFEMAAAHFTSAEALWRIANYDQAVRSLQTALRLAPNIPLYHRTLSVYYRMLGNVKEADGEMATSHRLRQAERVVCDDEAEV